MPVREPSNAPTSVAVIGGGPSALFLCHALEIQRRELVEQGQDVSFFPSIRCFERSGGPGGVWRSDRTHEQQDKYHHHHEDASWEEKKENSDPYMVYGGKQWTGGDAQDGTTNMYSGLWTNGCKEVFEFFDYTYKDHFGDVRMPTHLPRKYFLEYFLARVTRNCPDFFEKYFSFRTSVVYVEQQREQQSLTDTGGTKKFRIRTRNEDTGEEEVLEFDKCVWAAGINGLPYIPQDLVQILREGGFPGRIVHSSDTSQFKQDVEGKRVLLIGGGYSAEDLALMAIKEGAARVYNTCRDEEADMSLTTRWPYDMVTVYAGCAFEKVCGSTVTLQNVEWDAETRSFLPDTDQPKRKVLANIDTIIICTGYNANTNMLEPALRTELFAHAPIRVPEDWSMRPCAINVKILGDECATGIRPEGGTILPLRSLRVGHTNLYKGVFSIRDPDMMCLMEHDSYLDAPLLEIDISAWIIARVLAKRVALPSPEDMRADTVRIHLECLHDPGLRYDIDSTYAVAIDRYGKDDDAECKLWNENDCHQTAYLSYRCTGEIMNEYGYPVSFLEADGETFTRYCEVMNANNRLDNRDLKRCRYDDDRNDGTNRDASVTRPGWRTFRDDPVLEGCTSYFTGIRASSLPKPWVLLDEDDPLW